MCPDENLIQPMYTVLYSKPPV